MAYKMLFLEYYVCFQSSASIDHKSRDESKASGYNTVKSKAVFSKPNVTTDVNKIKPRTANFLVSAAEKNDFEKNAFLLRLDAMWLSVGITIFQSNVLPSF
jgi:hypothetical protein